MRPFNRLSGNYWILLRDENLVSSEILILTFLLTAPESTSVGILQASESIISDYTGLDTEEIRPAIDSLEKRHLIQTFFSDWFFIPMRWEFDCIPTSNNKSRGVSSNTLEHAFRELQNVPKACRGAFHAHFPEFQPSRLALFNKHLHFLATSNKNERDRDIGQDTTRMGQNVPLPDNPLTNPDIPDSRAIAHTLQNSPDPTGHLPDIHQTFYTHTHK